MLKLPCLGRPFRLGMLYDNRNDQLIPGLTFWDADTLQKFKISEPQLSSNYEVIAEDTLSAKAEHLGIEAGLKLSVLGGLVSVGGSGKYLDDHRSSNNQARVSLKYCSTTIFEQLSMEQLSKFQHPKVFDYDIATHVVVGVKYGADAFFIFDRMVAKDEKYCKIHGDLKVNVENIPQFGTKGRGSADIKERGKNETSKFQCKFYGDFILPNNPSTYEEAVKVYKKLPKFVDGAKASKAVPKEVWLYPLNKLDDKAKQLTREISIKLVSQVEKLMQDLHTVKIHCTDIRNNETIMKFTGLQEQMSEFDRMIVVYKTDIAKQMADMLPTIRGGGIEESELAKIIIKDGTSPFSFKTVSTWLNKKEREIKILNASLEKLAEVEFLSNPGDLDTYIYGGEFKTVICFEYNVIQIQDSHLEAMNLYLSSGSVNVNIQSYRLWCDDRTLLNKLHASIKQFKEFALKNKEKKGVKFVAIDCTPDNPDDPQVPTIVLYENGTISPFILPGKPGKPSCVNVTSSSITIRWIQPKDGAENIVSYRVYYKLVTTDIWSHLEISIPNPTLKFSGFDAGDIYVFKICPVCKAGLSMESDISDPISTKPEEISLAEEVLKEFQHHKIENGPPVVYQVPLHCLLKQKVSDRSLNLRHGEELMIAKYEVGKSVLSPKSIQEKVIMVVGATGAGKTTLINGFVNYLYGVKRDHKFRFKVIADEGNKSKTESQTTDITAYTFYPRKGSPVSYTLTLIDTPGFGDSKDIERDKAIIKQVEHFFRIGPPYGVNILHGIGFVTKACDERLTITQMYVFQSILAIYGKDIEGNIFLMTTFCDGKRPLVIEAAKAAGVPFQAFFKFNNSALYTDGYDDFDQMFWDLGMNSFQQFFSAFEKVEPKSLSLTREVLKERQQLETFIQGLQNEVTMGLARIDELQQKERALKAQEDTIVSKKDSTMFTFDITVLKEVDLPHGTYTTTCLTCNQTCHDICIYNNDDDKYKCSAMEPGGRTNTYCRNCPGKCFWEQHKNTPYKFVLTQEKKIETFDDLEKQFGTQSLAQPGQDATKLRKHTAYKKAESELNKLEEYKLLVQKMVNTINAELVERQKKVFANVKKARESQQRLSEIALKSNPLTDEQYIELLIQSEKQEKKPGFMERIATLAKIKEQAKLAHTIQVVPDQSGATLDKKFWKIFFH